jgi:hypothetical protein
MGLCRGCQEALTEKDPYCPFCGYDAKTDTVNPAFKPDTAKSKQAKKPIYGGGGGIDPRIKKFAFAGAVLLIFSVLYKYNFNLGLVIADTKSIMLMKAGKAALKVAGKKNPASKNAAGKQVPAQGEQDVKLEWSDVKAFQASPRADAPKGLLLEGIFFDPAARSFATINGQVVSEGEAVQGATVTKIEKYSVELVADGKRVVLAVNQSAPMPKKN